MDKVPKPYAEFTKKHGAVADAYDALASACHEAGPLNDRERALVKLALSVGARMEGAVHAQVRKGLDKGLSAEEIRHVAILATTTVGFPSMMAAMTWVDDLLG